MELSFNLGALPPNAKSEVSEHYPIDLLEPIRRRTRQVRRPAPVAIETEADGTGREF